MTKTFQQVFEETYKEQTMRRTQADRMAEAARAQQMTEEALQRVQDRRTGEMYDPKIKFDELMNSQEFMSTLERLGKK